MIARRLPATVWAVVLLGAVLVGCGEDPGPPDDGSQAYVDTSGLAAAGVETLAADTPADADAATVAATLGDVGLTGAEPARAADGTAGLALDGGSVAGLLSVVGDADATSPYVVLVFDSPGAAATFAGAEDAAQTDVFDDATADDRRVGFFAGNLVGYADREGRQGVRAPLREALSTLAGLAG